MCACARACGERGREKKERNEKKKSRKTEMDV